jgi:hypothetical protein
MDLDSFSADVERRLKSTVFLVGAGVSMLEPSVLPSGNQLRDMAVREVCKRGILRRYWRQLSRMDSYRDIVPEIVFQELHDAVDDRLLGFFEVLRSLTPNLGHRVLARLTRDHDSVVLTTNFDLAIEEAGATRSRIVHLHGDLEDKQQMTVRIHQVSLGIAPRDYRAAAHLLKGRTLCVLGYSGRDLDIARLIARSGVRKMLWLIRRKEDRVLESIRRINVPCSVAVGDLRRFFRLVSTLHDGRLVLSRERRRPVSGRPTGWARGIPGGDRAAALAGIFFSVRAYRGARDLFLWGARFSQATHGRAWFKGQAANCMRITGEFNRGTSLLQRVLRKESRGASAYELAGVHNVLGLLLLERAEPDAEGAIPHFRRAAVLARRSTKLGGKAARIIFWARVHNNLGLALDHLGKTSAAIAEFDKSLRLKRQVGDILGVAQTSANVSLAHYKGRRFSRASQWQARASGLIDRYEMSFLRAYIVRRVGELACEQGRRAFGLAKLREALALYQAIGGSIFGAELTRTLLAKYGAGEVGAAPLRRGGGGTG